MAKMPHGNLKYSFGGEGCMRTLPLKKPKFDPPSFAASVAGAVSNDRKHILSRIEIGFDVDSIKKVEDALGIQQKEIIQLLKISPSTLKRRKDSGHLSAEESDRVYIKQLNELLAIKSDRAMKNEDLNEEQVAQAKKIIVLEF